MYCLSYVMSRVTLTTAQMRAKALPRRVPLHYYNPPGISLWRHRLRINEGAIPQIVLYGDSHLANIRKWEVVKEENGGPRPLDEAMLMHLKHCSVGGSTFKNIHQRTRNINVPSTQPDRGDQWEKLLEDADKDPTYILCSLGSNDCDSFGQRLSWLTQQQLLACANPQVYGTSMIRFDPLEYFNQELNKFVDQINQVVNRLENTFENAEVVFSSVFEHEYWDDLTICINWYMKYYRKHRVINLNGMIPPSLIKRDKVHYKNMGYRIYMDKCIGKLLEFYYRHNKI